MTQLFLIADRISRLCSFVSLHSPPLRFFASKSEQSQLNARQHFANLSHFRILFSPAGVKNKPRGPPAITDASLSRWSLTTWSSLCKDILCPRFVSHLEWSGSNCHPVPLAAETAFYRLWAWSAALAFWESEIAMDKRSTHDGRTTRVISPLPANSSPTCRRPMMSRCTSVGLKMRSVPLRRSR
jgi:hypothetical protein